jgi:hypothetical protein
LRFRLLLAVAALLAPVAAPAQTSPFLPDPLFRLLVNELSGDRAYENVRHLTHYHRTGGSRDFFAAAEWIRGAAAAAGLEDVKLVRQKWNERGWSCSSGEAWLVEPETKLAAYGDVAVSIANNSRTTHVTAELVDVGAGTSEADYRGREVAGKVVLASGRAATAHQEAVWKRGALGVISSSTNRPEPFDAPDQVAWQSIPFEAKRVDGVKDGTPGTFAVMISPRRARWLQKQMEGGRTLKVKVDIDADFQTEQAFVEGWIRGSEIHDQQVVLTAHIQEEMTSANDDGSGCANMLEIGRTLARLIREKKLPRPRRDIRFWWVNELSSEPQYFRENPQEPRRMLINVNQDMVGARQSWGGRVQYACRLPWSRPHPLEDVMESVLTAVRDGNTGLLSMWRGPLPQPFSREVTAVKGSREPFHARMVPYFGHSDHHSFTPAHVGVPATSLINWPDEYIHSTGDDLENIDATQLERNALVVAAVSLYFANAGDEDAATLASYVAARARSRIAGDVATGLAHLAGAAAADRDAAFRAARNLVRQSHRKEAASLAAVRRLAPPKGRAGDVAAQAAARLEASLANDLSALERGYAGITSKNPPNVDLTPDERKLVSRVYVPVADLGAYDDAMETVTPVEGLHAIMRFEVYNFADGSRDAYEVYEAVAAEALSAGDWHYGVVRPADVLEALERALKAGAYTLAARRGRSTR